MSDNPAPSNGVKMMLTAADRRSLRQLGFTQGAVDKMTPDEGTRYLSLARGEHPPFEFDNIPSHLTDLPQWVCWRYEVVDDALTKIPKQTNGGNASHGDPDTWTTFERARAAYVGGKHALSGIGFVFAKSDPFVGIDFDNCVHDGRVIGPAAHWVRRVDTYTELSPSRNGLKLFAWGTLPPHGRATHTEGPDEHGEVRKFKVEAYALKRFFTTTGWRWGDAPATVNERDAVVLECHAALFPRKANATPADRASQPVEIADQELLDIAGNARNGQAFLDLYNGSTARHNGDDSAADLALCNLLAFWTDRDAPRMDKLFRASGLMREKWRQVHSADGRTYGQMTIALAIEGCRKGYEPKKTDAKAATDAMPDATARQPAPDFGESDPGAATADSAAAPATSPARSPAATTLFNGDPIPLHDVRTPLMPSGLLTGWLGEMVEAVSAATETPRELAVTFSLAAVATVCQKRFAVRVEPGYFEPLNVWTIGASVPGTRKSAVMCAFTAELARWEQEQRQLMEPEIKRATSAVKTMQARAEKLRAKAAGSPNPTEVATLLAEIARIEAELPQIPTVPRLIAEDVTPEHLGTMMAANGERMGMFSDEGGVFDNLAGRYSNNVPNLDLFLKSYSGSHVRVDRGSRPSVSLNFPALTLGLSPQPDVLRGLASKPGFAGRGLLDRPLYLLPPHRLGYRSLEPQPVPEPVRAAYARNVRDLIGIPAGEDGQPHVLTLSPAAGTAWKAFQREVETMLRPEGSLSGALLGWGGKLPGNVARLAGLLHCADRTFRAVTEREIGGTTMESAIALGRTYMGHARVVFREMGADPAMVIARRLWDRIEKRKLETFTARELWMPLRAAYKKVLDIEPGLELLVDHNLIAEPHQADFMRRGRPTRTFKTHPKCAKRWAAPVREEADAA
jgi:hypothetical protein